MTAEPSGTGQAGPIDPATRSDVRVQVFLQGQGGLDVSVRSRVGALFGESIRAAVLAAAGRCGVEHARVEVDDRGALPFVLDARLDAAFDRAGAPPAVRHGPGANARTARDRLRRSRLYLPGNEPKFMINAGLHRPDGVILDLEDSVHPDHKDEARHLVRQALARVDFGPAERMVRINQGSLGLEDLDAVVPEHPNVILIPKVETAGQVAAVAERIRAIGTGEHPVWLMPIIESALGVEHAYAIATADGSVVALTIGLEDYTADLGVPKTLEGAESLYARMRLVNAARAAGVQAIDSVFGDVADMEGLADWARRSRGLGFEGMGCIHPRQIVPIHTAFAPTPAELEKARRIVEAYETAEREGRSVVSLGSRMVDPPVVLRARRLVAFALRAGLLDRPDSPGDSTT